MLETPTSSLMITALRPRERNDAHQPTAVIDAIVSMLRLLPGTELTVRSGYESDPDDRRGRLTVHLDTADAMLADELAVVLQADAEISWTEATPPPGTLVLTARPDAAELGFGAGGHGLSRWRLPSASKPNGTLFWRALNRWPDGHVEISAIADDDASFRMSLSLVSRSRGA